MFFTVHGHSLKGFNNCTKYYSRWYVAVPIYDITDLIGRSSTFPLISILSIFGVISNLPGEDPVEYNFS